MENLYRVLDEWEEAHYQAENIIHCNCDFEGFFCVLGYDKYRLDENLDEIISHIQHGNTTCSKWISCSKSLMTDIEKYSVSKMTFSKQYRPKIALIKNYSQNSFIIDGFDMDVFEEFKKCSIDDLKKVSNYIRSLPIAKIKKLVIDLNDTDFLSILCQIGFIRTKNGTIPSLESRAFRYARDSKEVLVLSSIKGQFPSDNTLSKRERVVRLLPPMVYDILYTLIKNGSLSENLPDWELYYIMKLSQTFPREKLNSIENSFYIWHYSCNYTLTKLIDLYDDAHLDVLSLYNEFLKLKRSILAKIIDWINLNINRGYSKEICLIDDNSHIIRSKGNYTKRMAELCGGTLLEVTPIENKPISSKFLSEMDNCSIAAIYQYDDNSQFYTLINGKVYNIYLGNFSKNKNYIKKLMTNT